MKITKKVKVKKVIQKIKKNNARNLLIFCSLSLLKSNQILVFILEDQISSAKKNWLRVSRFCFGKSCVIIMGKLRQNSVKMQPKFSQNSVTSWSTYRLKSFQFCYVVSLKENKKLCFLLLKLETIFVVLPHDFIKDKVALGNRIHNISALQKFRRCIKAVIKIFLAVASKMHQD